MSAAGRGPCQVELKQIDGVVDSLSLVDVLDFMTGEPQKPADMASRLATFSLRRMSTA